MSYIIKVITLSIARGSSRGMPVDKLLEIADQVLILRSEYFACFLGGQLARELVGVEFFDH